MAYHGCSAKHIKVMPFCPLSILNFFSVGLVGNENLEWVLILLRLREFLFTENK